MSLQLPNWEQYQFCNQFSRIFVKAQNHLGHFKTVLDDVVTEPCQYMFKWRGQSLGSSMLWISRHPQNWSVSVPSGWAFAISSILGLTDPVIPLFCTHFHSLNLCFKCVRRFVHQKIHPELRRPMEFIKCLYLFPLVILLNLCTAIL